MEYDVDRLIRGLTEEDARVIVRAVSQLESQLLNLGELLSMKNPMKFTTVETSLSRTLQWYFSEETLDEIRDEIHGRTSNQ